MHIAQHMDLFSICVSENEINGKTLLKLTETMVSRLLPKMKHQVQFLELQKSFQKPAVAEPPDTSASEADRTASAEATGYDTLTCTR